MPNWVIALMFSIGSSTWLYTKLQKYSGNNTKQSVIAVSVAAVVIFIVFLSILSLIF